MSIGTATRIATRTQTAVHLTDLVLGAFSHIVAQLGLSSAYLDRHWTVIEDGLKTWIDEGMLEWVRLEVGSKSNPSDVFNVPITYTTSGSGDISFVTSQARIARALAKFDPQTSGSSYRVAVKTSPGATEVDGWESTTAADLSGMASYALGGLGGGPGASASLSHYSR
jgi:hypothetical protein